jgi:hypothetical protein
MPPYFTVTGNNITVYLDVVADSDSGLGNPIDNILAQIAQQWTAIAAAYGLTLTFALGPNTLPQLLPSPPQINVITGATPPSGVQYFTLTTGRGSNAIPATRGAKISYVTYAAGTGYIYQFPALANPVPAVSHELGHILGLSDRYYDAIYWLKNWAINRTRAQVRIRQYYVPPNDFRDGVADPSPFTALPRLAVRASLPMAAQMTSETSFDPNTNPNGYDPLNNLMSVGSATLSPFQINIILTRATEQTYRAQNWVAVLGQWERNPASPPSAARITQMTNRGALNLAGPDFPTPQNYTDEIGAWMFPVWEANPQVRPLDTGTGLLFLPKGDVTPKRYPSISRFHRGRTGDGTVMREDELGIVKEKRRLTRPDGTHIDNITLDFHPDWMCYSRQMVRDMTGRPFW